MCLILPGCAAGLVYLPVWRVCSRLCWSEVLAVRLSYSAVDNAKPVCCKQGPFVCCCARTQCRAVSLQHALAALVAWLTDCCLLFVRGPYKTVSIRGCSSPGRGVSVSSGRLFISLLCWRLHSRMLLCSFAVPCPSPPGGTTDCAGWPAFCRSVLGH